MTHKHFLRSVLLILTLAVLAGGLLAGCGSAAEEATAVPTNPPPTLTAVPPTATAVPPTPTTAPSPTPSVRLGDEYRSETAGIVFNAIPDYDFEDDDEIILMLAPGADPDMGPAVAIFNDASDEDTTLEALFESVRQDFSEGNPPAALSHQADTTVDGLPGIAADITVVVNGEEMNGRLVVVLVTPTRGFSMVGAAPKAQWDDLAPVFDAVLASVSFFEPAAADLNLSPEPTAAANAVEIRQWAAFAAASSEFSDSDWNAMQAAGAPDTLVTECADLPTAWASAASDSADEWLELEYDTAVIPTQINIIETHSPDQVVKVELADADGNYREVYTGTPTDLGTECPYTLSIPLNVDYIVDGLRISLDQSTLALPWTEIDAVELVGIAAEGETAVAPNPAPVSADGDLTVTAIGGYEDVWHTWHAVGLLTNQSPRSVEAIEVEINALDVDGAVLATDDAWISLHRLAPGETTPFSLLVYDDLPGFDHFTADVIGFNSADFERAAVDVSGIVRTVDERGNIHITGELVNNGNEPIAINSVAAATFDAAGDVVTAEGATVGIGYLNPNDSGPFRVFMYGPADGADAIANQTIYVDAVVTAAEPDYGLALLENHHAYLDEYDEVHLVGEMSNNGDETVATNLLAAFYDADGNALDVEVYSLPLDLRPGEALPFDFTGVWTVLDNTPGLLDEVDGYTIWWDPFWTWTSSTETVDLTTTDDLSSFDGDSVTYFGQIVNDSGAAVQRAYILVGLRDKATGDLVATGYSAIYNDIPASGAADYQVDIEFPSGYDEDSLEAFFVVRGEK